MSAICTGIIDDGPKLVRHDCPTCERRRYFVATFYAWYGWSTTCLGCGERWNDGERAPRPFAPRWREQSKERARRHYRRHRERAEEGA